MVAGLTVSQQLPALYTRGGIIYAAFLSVLLGSHEKETECERKRRSQTGCEEADVRLNRHAPGTHCNRVIRSVSVTSSQ